LKHDYLQILYLEELGWSDIKQEKMIKWLLLRLYTTIYMSTIHCLKDCCYINSDDTRNIKALIRSLKYALICQE